MLPAASLIFVKDLIPFAGDCSDIAPAGLRNPPMTAPRNKVVQVRRFGGPDGLEVVDAPLPTAGRGEVRVRMLASGLEYTDVVIRRHLYPQTMRRRPPFVLGYDIVGAAFSLATG